MRNLVKERVGIINKNSYGSLMKIIKYDNARNILVKFLDSKYATNASWEQFCKGEVRNVYDKSVYSVGYIGEGKYKTKLNGKHTQQYSTWRSMIQRCYDKKYHEKQPTYINVKVTNEWHNFQNFAKWFDGNYYEISGEVMSLDKDILVKGNKIYSPDTCMFVPKRINSFFVKCDSSRGNLPIGVIYHKENKKYVARTTNGNGSKRISLGSYFSPEEAFIAYKKYREKLIKQIAEEYKDKIPSKLYNAMLTYKVEIND